jgi:hypothetical protein
LNNDKENHHVYDRKKKNQGDYKNQPAFSYHLSLKQVTVFPFCKPFNQS